MSDQAHILFYDGDLGDSGGMVEMSVDDPNYIALHKAGRSYENGGPVCRAYHHGFFCTREEHPGSYLHVACGPSEVAAVWSDTPKIGEGII